MLIITNFLKYMLWPFTLWKIFQKVLGLEANEIQQVQRHDRFARRMPGK